MKKLFAVILSLFFLLPLFSQPADIESLILSFMSKGSYLKLIERDWHDGTIECVAFYPKASIILLAYDSDHFRFSVTNESAFPYNFELYDIYLDENNNLIIYRKELDETD